jgi:hypothetical protein
MIGLKKYLPLLISLLLFWGMILILTGISLKRNQNHFIYALDDPYIHMAMAKNLAENGAWGVNKNEFASSSSSPLWIILLGSVYRLAGVSEMTPFIMNIIIATLFICLYFLFIKEWFSNPFFQSIALIVMIFVIPLPGLAFSGQEHILHVLLTLSFIILAGRCLSLSYGFENFITGKNSCRRLKVWLLIIAPGLTMIRYESLFLIMVVSLFFVFRKKFRYAILLSGLGLLPVIVYGIISTAKGWFFLPNPVILKGFIPEPFTLKGLAICLNRSFYNLYRVPALLMLILSVFVFLFYRIQEEKNIWNEITIYSIIFLSVAWFHLQFAAVGWLVRYEAYLVCTGIYCLTTIISGLVPQQVFNRLKDTNAGKLIIIAAAGLIIIYPFFKRASLSAYLTPIATSNIYHQQYQMSSFLKQYYHGETIALNDIGLVSLKGEVEIVDLLGLTDLEVAKAIRYKYYDAAFIDRHVKERQASIAAVYDIINTFYRMGDIPSNWIKVAEWEIPQNTVCASPIISFYAFDPKQAERLKQNLIDFSSQLPGEIQYRKEF